MVVMPNHCHVLVTPGDGVNLTKWMGSVKKFSARKANAATARTGSSLWQEESYDHIVRDRDELARIRRYINSNPKQAKLPEGTYAYHRAAWMDEWCDMDQQYLRGGVKMWSP